MKKLLTIRHSKGLLMMLFISLIFCSACRKEDSDFRYVISRSLYPMMFIEGSYWIYKNTDDSILDTVVLTRAEIYTLIYGIKDGLKTQVYNTYYISSQFGVFEKQLREDYITNYILYSQPINGEPGRVEYLSCHVIGYSYYEAQIADIYDSFIVNEKSYSNVVKMNVGPYSGISDYKMKDLYYVDYVGIVKKVLTKEDDSIETWELLEHNVTLYKMN